MSVARSGPTRAPFIAVVLALTLAASQPRVALAIDKERAAGVLAQEAAKRFESGDMTRAGELYLAAYAVSPNPLFVYGAARASQSSGQNQKAGDLFRQFLSLPSDDPERTKRARDYLAGLDSVDKKAAAKASAHDQARTQAEADAKSHADEKARARAAAEAVEQGHADEKARAAAETAARAAPEKQTPPVEKPAVAPDPSLPPDTIIAVLNLRATDKALTLDESVALTDFIRARLPRTLGPNAKILSREKVFEILASNGRSANACTGECEVQTGREIGAAYVVTGSAAKVGGKLLLMVEFKRTRDGATVAAEDIVVPSTAELLEKTGTLMEKLAREFVVALQKR